MHIRDEMPADAAAISALVAAAFATAPHSSGTEAAIVDALRDASALTVSLVALEGQALTGHVAISPVRISTSRGWFGLGPVSVQPLCQGRGIGTALINAALERLKVAGAQGCVVVGDPGYYCRFGFTQHQGLSYGDIPAPYLQALSFAGPVPQGDVVYHQAFAA